MVKRRGKSPPDAVATRYAARLMGCKAMYTGTRVESPPFVGLRIRNGLLAHRRGVGCSSTEAKRGAN